MARAFIICGNGFFKPNISSLAGTLYSENDERRDSVFSIFYMGINIGAAIGRFLCAYVGTKINWHYGYFNEICSFFNFPVTKLSPARIVSLMMGIWFFASAIGEFLAGKIGSLISVPKDILAKNDPTLSMPYYEDVILKIGVAAVAIGVLLMFTFRFSKDGWEM